MAIFANGEELRNEGLQFMYSRMYDKAIKSFSTAIKKGDYESIVLLSDAKWEFGAKTEAIQDLLRYKEDEALGLSDGIKIDIYKRLMKYDDCNMRIYRYQAACLNDFESMKYMFDCDWKSEPESAAEWADKILCHENCDKVTFYETLNQFEKMFDRYVTEERDGDFYYYLKNETLGKFTRMKVLFEISKCEAADNIRKGSALCEIGRMMLIEKIYTRRDKKDCVEYYRRDAYDVYDYFKSASDYGYLPAYYYVALLLYAGINCDKNEDAAKRYLDRLIENKDMLYKSDLINTVFTEDIYAFSRYINCRGNLSYWINELKGIIGHDVFKKKIDDEIKMVCSRYDTFLYNSNFRTMEYTKRQIDHKIIIMNGQPSNCKYHLADIYARILFELYKIYNPYHYDKKNFVSEIKNVDIDSIGGLENKIDYIRRIMIDENDSNVFKFLYFDQPYNINDPKGENYYYIIMNNLVREVLSSSNKILFLAGDGDLIIEELKSIGIREYCYVDDIIDCNGYSEQEALMLLDLVNTEGNVVYDENIRSEISKIIKTRNQQYPVNIDYDEIRDISRIINGVYFSLHPNYRNDIRNYQDVFFKIEARLGIEKISENTMKEAIAELEGLIGLRNIKEEVYKIIDTVTINNKRMEMGLRPITRSMHMVFYGNPGTGKTTVARLMGKILKELGVLEKGHLIEKSRGDLVSQYFGATAGKTKEILKQALNGVLFIDEAYTLTNSQGGGSMKDYGQEAVEEILKFMSDKEGQIAVIVAGYKEEMREFLKSNPGLESRFTTKLEFENYTDEELYEIFERLCTKNDFDIEEGSKPYILEQFKEISERNCTTFGNARFVNQYFAEITKQRSKDLAKKLESDGFDLTKEALRLLPVSLFEAFQFHE